ncbi:MAG: hypothetical protein HYU66_04160 [Armatimonadetes bacterium]|nr:hypothetical protein [Armatimonadota bacterium]
MRIFHHVGIPIDEKQAGETYVPATKVSVTDPMKHPYKIEYLRYEPDSPVTGPLRNLPHIAWRTDQLDQDLAGEEILLEPFAPMPGMRVAFIFKDGAVQEFMEFEDYEGSDWG